MSASMRFMANGSGLAGGEESVLRVHQHWKTVLWPVLVLAATVVALLVLLLFLPTLAAAARLALGAIALIVVIIWTAVPLLRWRTTSYELTTRRLRLRTGILTRSGRDFPLSRMAARLRSAGGRVAG
jgi:uncharacterized membrane protein YdbT with pleckstrin-like domain